MQYDAYVTAIAVSAFYLIASWRFMRLALRTRKRPELYLGLYFALTGVYYLGNNLPDLAGLEPWPTPTALALEWTYVLGVFPYLFFLRAVFRPESRWADLAVGACTAFLLVGTIAGTREGPLDFSLDNPWYLSQWVGYTVPCAWIVAEAMPLWQSARRRARIGLCPPVVANRYLLLALFGGFQILACLADLAWASDLGAGESVSTTSDLLLGFAETASVSVLWLAFFPPPLYREWIRRSARILPTPMDG
jgi:hypothetical protein